MINYDFFPKVREKTYEKFSISDLAHIIEFEDPWRVWTYFKFHNAYLKNNTYNFIGGRRCIGKIWKKSHNYFVHMAYPGAYVVFWTEDYYISVIYDHLYQLERIHLYNKKKDIFIDAGKEEGKDEVVLTRRIEKAD